jgi:hypothetical protein
MSRRWVVTAIVAASVAGGLAEADGSPAAPAAAASTCANLRAPSTLHAKLSAAYQTAHRGSTKKQIGPLKGSTFYGRCGATHWAIAEFGFADGSEMDDQPETLRQLGGAGWKDRGDDGAICAVPHALTTLWGERRLQSAICGSA